MTDDPDRPDDPGGPRTRAPGPRRRRRADEPDDARESFVRLYDENYRRVLAYALTHTEPHTAEDVAAETFLVAWRRRAEVIDPSLPWLLGVARNLLHKQWDGKRRRAALAERMTAMTTTGDLSGCDVADHVVTRDSALTAVARLPEADLEVLTLVMWHDLTPRQAAQVIGCSVPAFSVRLHRARRRLARALDGLPHRSTTSSPWRASPGGPPHDLVEQR